ncbi:glycan-binding surface protein [Pseudobacter ginsenosidimutans]|uniref:Surface glycan-binding protein B xyloglucan binding domain-containing protein n=1 Tax=Pseudobacter ginsenosidimutans TaxID=661488 RepID=A0A4Q7N4C4_9BACT|nr:glycan-binding surface protein [Pseudobacter ginsenosidimutans]QEC44376.1 hypothetical protein FSB84_22860 [Pseudobacter ginsenosidimutans]RZS75841.1 hypothetical protein EV199_1716 [Pseudobacter ginsenosidimutans]
MKKSIIFFLFFALLAGFAGCSKNDDPPPGAPKITRVTTTIDRTTALTNGELNQWLLIFGENLSGTQKVEFNDLVAEYSNIYSNDTLISVQIPRKLPGNTSNKLVVTTSHGSASFDFPIEIPQLSNNGFEFDYPAIGSELVINGDNFDLYGFTKEGTTVTFTGGVTASLTEATATTLKMLVPAGAQAGALTVKGSAPLSSTFTTKAWYLDNRNILLSMDPFTGWNGAAFISNGPNPTTFAGQKYFKITKTFGGGWAWDPFMSNRIPVPAELVNNQNNFNKYTLKFEVFAAAGSAGIPSPINIVFQDPGYKETWFDPSGRGQYPFTTNGKWMTMSCPMTNFAGHNFPATPILEIMLRGENAANSDFAITNFRIVPQ